MNGAHEQFKVGDYVSFFSYGAIRYGHIARIANGIVWLTNGRWLHIHSVYHAYTL